MAAPHRRTSRLRRSLARLACGVTLTTTMVWAVPVHTQNARPGPQPRDAAAQTTAAVQKAALKDFEKRLGAYITLRKALSRKLEPLRTTDDATELSNRQKTLAAAIAQARNGATRGDLIPPEVAAQIKEAVVADLATREAQAKRATLEEVPDIPLHLNRPFPADAALTTIPPLLLARLPALPDNLQYRFAGRHLALLDGDVHIVLDYVERVLPPK